MKLAFAGGGTGGHLAPAIALLEEIRARKTDGGSLFLTSGPAAEDLLRSAPGSQVFPIPAASFTLRRPGQIPARLLLNWRGYRRAIKIFRRFRPDLVIGLGGYVSLPPVLAARRLKIPAVCHEQNRILGRANRFLARGPVRLITAFPLSGVTPGSGRAVCLGAPIRRAAREPIPEGEIASWGLEPGRFTLLVLGGSRGARPLNRLLEESATSLADAALEEKIQIIHAAGREDSERLKRAYGKAGLAAAVFPGLEKIGWAYSLSDLAVSRAGGATLSELVAWGIPAILVPYPYATEDHQLANARYFQRAGAAVLYPEPELTVPVLVERIKLFRSDPEMRRKMAASARRLHRPAAAGEIIDYLKRLIADYDQLG